MRLRVKLRKRVDAWILRRQGLDDGPVRLRRGRIFILPTPLGIAFGLMLLAMVLGSLNYANNLGLALSFLLAALGVVAMQSCHRTLEGLVARAGGTEPPFAGQEAVFRLILENPSVGARHDLEATTAHAAATAVSLQGGGEQTLELRLPTRRRGLIRLERIEIATRYPYGLFRAWAVLHPGMRCLVYPRPADRAPPPPPAPGPAGRGDRQRGEDDFAGLKDYHPGDPPRHIAWKAYARGGELLVKQFAGAAEPTPEFDLDRAPGGDLEQRLSVISRWIVDADARGQAYGLRLPGMVAEPEPGSRQRRRCLAALAEYQPPVTDD